MEKICKNCVHYIQYYDEKYGTCGMIDELTYNMDSHNPQDDPSDKYITVQVITDDDTLSDNNEYPYSDVYVGENFGCIRFNNK